MDIDTVLLEAVEKQVFSHLEAQFPEGFKEHELLKLLTDQSVDANGLGLFVQPYDSMIDLFKAHFFLFHVLYRLRHQLAQQGQYDLIIGALDIRLQVCDEDENQSPSGQSLSEHDALASYYLDLSQLESTTADQVNDMLKQFYCGLTRHDGRAAALATLGLSDPVDNDAIKYRYRKLAMDHHPDRGGCQEKFQEIHAAVELLLG